MGALTSNRKRGDEYLSLNHGIPSLSSPNSNSQSAKRPRLLSPSMNPSPVSSKSAISRVSRYPDAKTPLPRLHAPCGNLKLGLNSGLVRRPSRDREPVSAFDKVMGNFVSSNYFRAKNRISSNYARAKSSALAACRFLWKEKDFVEVDRDVEEVVVVDDLSFEEVVVVDDIERGSACDSDAKMAAGGDRPSSSSVGLDLSNATLKVESLSLDVDPGMSSVSVYKKLLRAVEDRDTKLNQLSFDIEFNEQRRNLLQSPRPVKKPVEEIPREPFIPLTKEEETEVQRAFSANRRKVLVVHENSNIEITGQVFQCLRPGAWLNDEVINVYLELLKEREKRDPKSVLKCHFFNTFFYKKLILGGGYDYKSVRRWTTQRKLGYSLADCDKIFVPVHKEIHWCLAVINKKEEKFQYLDSLGGRDNQVMKVLERYYADEVKDKCGKEINLISWKHEFVEDLPEQQNGFDCGVFMIKYADFYSRGLRLCFSQEHMPYFRLRTAKEILRLRAD